MFFKQLINTNGFVGVAIVSFAIILVLLYIFPNHVMEPMSMCLQKDVVCPDTHTRGPFQPNVTEYGGKGIGITKDALTEGFVPWNSTDVGKYQISLVSLDQHSLESLFQSMIQEDRDKINTSYLSDFKDQPTPSEQATAYINHVLARINRKSDRHFHILDIQSTNKQSAFDTNSGKIVDKWTAELFIQEKDSRKVHASAMNIRIQMLCQNNTVQILELHFMTDYFYKKPLIDGENVYDRHFRILNPFHLQQPFFTSEDKVLPATNTSDKILVNQHKDLRKPEYRCFNDDNNVLQSGDSEYTCDTSQGYWDTPVVNDSECPFFLANKQYPNRLGGVNPDGNSCEMPIGTKKIGYRFLSNDPVHKPWCYNCHVGSDGMPGSIGPCCDEQRNVELYPELGGNPDYAFPGDVLERGQNWKVLQQRGLNWRANPTNIRDITNPMQKQPVFNAFIGPGPGKI